MKAKLMFAIIGTALMLSASDLTFLRPLFTEKDRVTEPLLTGSWTHRESDEEHPALVITDRKEGEYLVDVRDWDFLLKAHLVRLGEFQFLDLTAPKYEVNFGSHTVLPAPHVTQAGEGVFLVLAPSDKSDPRDSARVEVLAAHLICRIDVDPENLRVACIEGGDWVARAVAGAELSVGTDSETVISSTEELRTFLLKHAQDDSLFTFKLDLHRQKTPEAGKP